MVNAQAVELFNPVQAHQVLTGTVWPHAKNLLMAGHRLVLELRLAEDAKTDKQRRYYHGFVLKTIAEQAVVNGQKFPIPVWKEHFRSEYLGFKVSTHINPTTGKKSRRRIRISTEDIGVKRYSLLIEQVTAYAVTDLGVVFPSDWVDPETGEVYQR